MFKINTIHKPKYKKFTKVRKITRKQMLLPHKFTKFYYIVAIFFHG